MKPLLWNNSSYKNSYYTSHLVRYLNQVVYYTDCPLWYILVNMIFLGQLVTLPCLAVRCSSPQKHSIQLNIPFDRHHQEAFKCVLITKINIHIKQNLEVQCRNTLKCLWQKSWIIRTVLTDKDDMHHRLGF